MTGLVRRASLFCAVGLLAASAAMAGVPSAGTSALAPGIALVGYTNPADPTPHGACTFTIRDASNNPVPGSTVIINFSACTDIKLCSNILGAGVSVNCAAKTATAVTNAAGQVTFRVVGSSNATSGIGVRRDGPGQLDNACAPVTADGVAMNSLIVSAFDLTGVTPPGVDGGDLFVWGQDFQAGDFGRSDYDADGDTGGNDLFRWGQVFSGGASALGCHNCQP